MRRPQRWAWPVREYRYRPDLARLLALWVLAAFGAALLAAIGLGHWLDVRLVAREVPACGLAGAIAVAMLFVRMWRQGRFEPEPGPMTRAHFESQLAKLRAYADELATLNEQHERALSKLHAQLADARRAAGQSGSEGDYAALKRAFVRRYHPDKAVSESSLAPDTRARMFKDFYPQFAVIERQRQPK